MSTKPSTPSVEQTDPSTEQTAPITILPLPSAYESIEDCTIAISLQEGGISEDSDGTVLLTATLFEYDLYDAAELFLLKAGDSIVIRQRVVAITSIEESSYGTLLINGGLDAGGYELRTDDNTVYYETGYSDVKSWQELGVATLPVSPEFIYTDRSDLDSEPVIYSIHDFLEQNSSIDYHFTEHNTRIVIEGGIVTAMERIYTP